MMRKGRGSFEERRLVSESCELTYVRWFDNRIVHLLSSFAKPNPVHLVERFDKKAKRKIEINCPDIVKQYNQSMGGVDKADFLISLYRTPVKSKKYYMKLIFHMLDMLMVNSWLLYKRDVNALKLKRKEILSLSEFKMKAAFALMKEGKVPKRGRPSNENPPPLKKKCFARTSQPEESVRFDNVAHYPRIDKARRICRLNGCEGRTNVVCTKCNVHLCLYKNKNHFYTYHCK